METGLLKLTVVGTIAVVILALIYAGKYSGTETAQPPQGVLSNSKAFSLLDMDGKLVSLADYKGKVVFVNFWATWCGPCRQEIPDLIELYKEYKDKGFEILGVSMDDGGAAVVKPFADQLKINYKILLNGNKVAGAYGVTGIPATFVVDRQGNIRNTLIGIRPKPALEAEIKSLL
jgi:thiol-disulfide isomerase/thioredoxin